MVSSPPIWIPKVPDQSLPPQRERRRWRRFRDKRPQCPYCLERLGSPEDEGLGDQTCPICRHEVPVILQLSPPHLFDKVLRWALIYHELDHIWKWEYMHLKGFQHTTGGFGKQYSKAKQEFEDLNEAVNIIQGDPEAFHDIPVEADVKIILTLRKYRRGGRLARDLSKGRRWRRMALEMSARSADPFEIMEFQWDMVRAAPWGAYGYYGFEEKRAVLRVLEERMGQRAAG